MIETGRTQSKTNLPKGIDIHVDNSDSNVDVYQLIVDEHGIQHGKKVYQTYRVKFDPAKGEYIVPKELEQGY